MLWALVFVIYVLAFGELKIGFNDSLAAVFPDRPKA
jgi:hypothetical protein